VPPFPKPRFAYEYDLDRELVALRAYRRTKPGRQIPRKSAGRLLLATWNIANLGVQDRLDSDYALMAEVIGWVDLVAVQEVNDQIAFFPGSTKTRFTGATNVFDFDCALFADLWQERPGSPFLSYVRYHISDHRPLRAEFETT
jgi:hypothetical protein